jgi:hypothetical protein
MLITDGQNKYTNCQTAQEVLNPSGLARVCPAVCFSLEGQKWEEFGQQIRSV